MVARRNGIGAVSAQFTGDIGGQAKPARGVFAVGNTEIDLVLLNQARD